MSDPKPFICVVLLAAILLVGFVDACTHNERPNPQPNPPRQPQNGVLHHG